MTSTVDASFHTGSSAPSDVRIIAMLALRAALMSVVRESGTDDGWLPRDDTLSETGGNTSFALGRVKEDRTLWLLRHWARLTGVKAPLLQSHVLDDCTSFVCEEVIVD